VLFILSLALVLDVSILLQRLWTRPRSVSAPGPTVPPRARRDASLELSGRDPQHHPDQHDARDDGHRQSDERQDSLVCETVTQNAQEGYGGEQPDAGKDDGDLFGHGRCRPSTSRLDALARGYGQTPSPVVTAITS
jgi:hypothetical protein